jgi:hypothetical protein
MLSDVRSVCERDVLRLLHLVLRVVLRRRVD